MSVPNENDPLPTTRDPLSSLKTGVDRLFDEFTVTPFMAGLPSVFGSLASFGDLSPQTDIRETETEVIVTTEMPGIKEDDVTLSLQNRVLTLKGEKKSESRKDEDNYHMVERRYGAFQRSFRLPDSIDEEAVTAKLEDGVLTVAVAKRKEAQKTTKKIKIARK